MVLNGTQRFMMPRVSPMVISKLISTVTSLGGTICTSCGLLSVCVTRSFKSQMLRQAFSKPLIAKSRIRLTSRSSISVNGRFGSVKVTSFPPPSKRSTIG